MLRLTAPLVTKRFRCNIMLMFTDLFLCYHTYNNNLLVKYIHY